MNEEMKPCPFCGGTESHDEECYLQKMEYHIQYLEIYLGFAMEKANLNTPVAHISEVYKNMGELWNTRAEPTEQAAKQMIVDNQKALLKASRFKDTMIPREEVKRILLETQDHFNLSQKLSSNHSVDTHLRYRDKLQALLKETE